MMRCVSIVYQLRRHVLSGHAWFILVGRNHVRWCTLLLLMEVRYVDLKHSAVQCATKRAHKFPSTVELKLY